VNPRAGLHDVEKKHSGSYRGSNSDPSVVQPVASRYIDYVIPALFLVKVHLFCLMCGVLFPAGIEFLSWPALCRDHLLG
jgi:hypothetical protein